MLPWWPWLVLISWCPIFRSSHYISFEDRAPVDGIHQCLSCSDLTIWEGTEIVTPAMAYRWHALLNCCTNPTMHHSTSHNAPFGTEMCMCAHFCYKMVHYGIFVWCIMGFVRWVIWMSIWGEYLGSPQGFSAGYLISTWCSENKSHFVNSCP